MGGFFRLPFPHQRLHCSTVQSACCFLRWVADLLSPEGLFPPTVCMCQSLCSLGLFPSGSWPPPSGLFSRPLCIFLFRSPDLPSSHYHSFPRPSLGTAKFISPSLMAEFLPRCRPACLPLPVYLALPMRASHSTLVLVSAAGAPVHEQLLARAVFYFFYLSASLLLYIVKYQPYSGLSSLGISLWVVRCPCTHTPLCSPHNPAQSLVFST